MSIDSRYLTVCEEAVRSAGKLLVERMGRVQVREKGPADLVTEADLASQEIVRRTVLGAFPHHSLLGEEGPHDGGRTEYRWVVDPLDGTTNYVHGIPFFAVSLALERNGELLVGAVYNPISEECFTAIAGSGAYLNGKRLRVSGITELDRSVAAAGLPAQVNRQSPDMRVFVDAAQHCQSVRRTGSAALNLAYVAAGRMDVFWSFSTKIWDIAAAALMVREAGGTVTAPDGGPFDLERAHFLATASPQLHGNFVRLIGRALA